MGVAERFAQNVLRLRRRRGISQRELGLRASLHPSEVGVLEQGRRIPRIDTLLKLASGLGVRIDCALLDGMEWMPAEDSAGRFEVEDAEAERRRAGPLRYLPRTSWWEEPLAVLADRSLESIRMPSVTEGLRASGMVLIRALQAYPWDLNFTNLVEGLAQEAGSPEDTERFREAVIELASRGLIVFSAFQVTATPSAAHLSAILQAAHELRFSRR